MKIIIALLIIFLSMSGCDNLSETSYTSDGFPIMKSEYGKRLQLEYLMKESFAMQRYYEEQQRRREAGLKTLQERNKIELIIDMEYGEILDKWGTPDRFTSYETVDKFTIIMEYGIPKDTTLTFHDYKLFSIQRH